MSNRVWQACPVCGGRGVVAWPPGTPLMWPGITTQAGPFMCEVCHGKKILATPDSSPAPFQAEEHPDG